MREIRVGRSGLVALVDDADYERVAARSWSKLTMRCGVYACHWWRDDTGQHTILMHRFILDAPSGVQVDHRNGNGLDNQRTNIRLCTQTQNLQNRRVFKNSGTGFKGVTADKARFRAQIKVNGVLIRLGRFATAEEGARAYDLAARQHFGEFAKPNFPEAS